VRLMKLRTSFDSRLYLSANGDLTYFVSIRFIHSDNFWT
jgi:hypothetical protein